MVEKVISTLIYAKYKGNFYIEKNGVRISGVFPEYQWKGGGNERKQQQRFSSPFVPFLCFLFFHLYIRKIGGIFLYRKTARNPASQVPCFSYGDSAVIDVPEVDIDSSKKVKLLLV